MMLNLNDYLNNYYEKEEAKALIAVGATGGCVVITTNSEWLTTEMNAVGSCSADDLGIDYSDCDAGLYLWEGTLKTVNSGPWDCPEPETEIIGKVREVQVSELPSLLNMSPPAQLLLEDGDADTSKS